MTNGTEMNQTAGPESRVSIICDSILNELLANYATTHSQCILTAHLSKIPPDLPSALRTIAKLKGTSSPPLPLF
jgi:elongator complex protein 1